MQFLALKKAVLLWHFLPTHIELGVHFLETWPLTVHSPRTRSTPPCARSLRRKSSSRTTTSPSSEVMSRRWRISTGWTTKSSTTTSTWSRVGTRAGRANCRACTAPPPSSTRDSTREGIPPSRDGRGRCVHFLIRMPWIVIDWGW